METCPINKLPKRSEISYRKRNIIHRKRKIIQATMTDKNAIVVCNDGSWWDFNPRTQTWKKLPDVPENYRYK